MNAGLLRRLAAAFYDLLLVVALTMVGTALVMPFTDGEAVPAGTLWFQLYLLLLVYGFFTGFWAVAGQTLGMRAWRLRLVTDSGGAPDWRDASIRFLAAWLAWSPALAGVLWLAFDPERLAWHDRLSRTRIIHTPR